MCKESLIFSISVHLGPRTGLPDKIVKEDHQRIILAKLGSNWPLFIFSNSGHVGWRSGLPDAILKGDHPRTIHAKFSSNWPCSFRDEDFKIFIPLFWFSVTAAMLVEGRNCRTQFWKSIAQGQFHQRLVLIGQVVSEEKIF